MCSRTTMKEITFAELPIGQIAYLPDPVSPVLVTKVGEHGTISEYREMRYQDVATPEPPTMYASSDMKVRIL